ncbi:helix-turn-helix domain-containing protein [Paenibacillus sp. D2_2]|uniref:helix-turn-helix domain-containing protein n=1 Tax=Paenibacillus sp. D2_2 TaxID=3073092 RepID=UPI0028152335|nr:helix-turn-helix domain-containing protein [Paenibacillus sp. D2_2]WMT38974.1 helix-turn-helix domain-containing protein [Paenibacillus sp. D2_2]
MAKAAGVSTSHFSVLFKQHTSFSPSEYLSRLRVHRAKELLIIGSSTLREIATKVGYKDEFYLSRRFKQHTGTSPSDYNKGGVQQVAVLLAPYASHLLTLGMEPSITITETSEYVHTDEIHPSTMKFIDIRSSWEQMKKVLMTRQVEIIIGATEHMREYGLSAEQLRVVAPVVEIAWMEMGWKEHLRLIARAVQRSERAEQWLTEFEQEEKLARKQIQNSPVVEEIITIFVIKPEGVFVYGARNVGYVIYRSLGLRPPALIEAEIRKYGDQFHSVPIELSDMELYADSGSRLLVIVYPDEKGSTIHSEQIFGSPYWHSLPAVQQKRVDLLDVDDWVPYNPVSVRLQLQRAVELLISNQ